jgi:hypothetical protein
MTKQADFTPEEWTQVLEGPPSAGVLVITASRGGTFRETFSMGKAYAEARQRHGQSELLDAIVAAKPKTDHARYHSPGELKEHALQHIRDAVALLQAKATPQPPTPSTASRSARPSAPRSARSMERLAAAVSRGRAQPDSAGTGRRLARTSCLSIWSSMSRTSRGRWPRWRLR